MAKSIYEIVESGTAEVTHNGAECLITMPDLWLEKAAMAFNSDDDSLRAYVTTMDIEKLQAWLQVGSAKELIEVRAVARPADYGKADGGGKRELMEKDHNGNLPQDRVDAYEFKPYKKPGEGKEIKAKDVDAALAKLSPEELATLLAKYQS